jgi:hypothetical protein
MIGRKTLAALAAAVTLAACDGGTPTELRTPSEPRLNTALTAYVVGPSSVRPGDTCMWEAVASGGVPPYEYRWEALGNYSSDPTYFTTYSGIGPTIRRVWILDAVHHSTFVDYAVHVTNNAAPC